MDELIKAMSNEDLAEMKEQHKDNESIVNLIAGILEARANEAEQAKAKKQFEAGIGKLFAKLPHPEDVHNVYIRWAEVEVEDASQPQVELSPDVCKANDLPAGTKRHPTTKGYQWVVEVNKGFAINKNASGASASKRAITLFKRDGLELKEVGNYLSASKACASLKITIGGDSASRVLSREGYIIEPYTGSDFTS